MEGLKVPKRRTPVEVLLPGGAVRQVAVYLAEFASGHAGPERLSDLLNGDRDFIAALDAQTDAISFLHRNGIAAARVSREIEAVLADEFTIPTEHEVEITLVDGTRLRGLVIYVLPPERSRLLDYLNDDQPFVRLIEPQSIALVNKRHVSRVAPIE